MQAISTLRTGALILGTFLLGSCDASFTGGQAFREQYAVARNALEAGHYTRANSAYTQLMPEAGPLAPRLRLEYAHSQLRAGDYPAAAREAGAVAAQTSGAGRSAALAVLGTAEHEIALAALAEGEKAAGKAHLVVARGALTEVLEKNPELDPLGALAGRKASIEVRLAAL